MKFPRFQAVFLALFLLCGCATDETHTTYYVDENGKLSAGEDLATELQLIASAMTNSMTPTVKSGKNMRYPPKWPSKEKPLAIIVELDNRTKEFMDSKIITDAIRVALR
jgi:PBP1b-binding outer membrane lipoprotein LpoB